MGALIINSFLFGHSYTFGQPVKGKAFIQVDGPGKWQYELRREIRLSTNFTIPVCAYVCKKIPVRPVHRCSFVRITTVENNEQID